MASTPNSWNKSGFIFGLSSVRMQDSRIVKCIRYNKNIIKLLCDVKYKQNHNQMPPQFAVTHNQMAQFAVFTIWWRYSSPCLFISLCHLTSISLKWYSYAQFTPCSLFIYKFDTDLLFQILLLYYNTITTIKCVISS